ncbi:hypothetical protein SUGI_0381880 [Cryptomeria japonica]|nr:hypothetical protein SUGI_0381880 [Cryptomeria japonica]
MDMKMALVFLLPLLLFLSALPSYISLHSSHYSDQEALLSFKSSLSLDPYNSLFDWHPNHTTCNWTGILCSSRHQRVISLNLTGMSLMGPISPFLCNLSFLRVISLSNNSLQGHIPPQLGRLFRLRMLDLSINELEGSIPSTLADCQSLQVLILSSNHLSSNIPSQFGLLSHLKKIGLEENQLTGTIPVSLGNLSFLIDLRLANNHLQGGIPLELGMLSQLKVLYLNINNLSGEIPPTLFNCTLLHKLSVCTNKLSGYIPWQFGKLSKLQLLHLWGNQFIGEIPRSLFNCTQLQRLDLGNNQLSGEIPLEFGKLRQLLVLYLLDNHFVSKSNDLSILTALTNCSYLKILDLSLNNLTSILPSSISQLSSQLSYLGLSSNKIEGNILSGISNLTMLGYINLSKNCFNGTIPFPLFQLQHLERLYLDKNNLYGSIPKNLGDAKSLGLLSLSENTLSGEIPNSLGDLPQLRYLILHHNQLSGKIPTSLGRLQTLELMDLSHNKLRGNIPPELIALKNLQFYFNTSNNLLQGSLLEMSKMVMVQAIDVSLNNFSGEIPTTLSSCTNLQYLNLSWNSFYGPIPTSLTKLKNLQDIDLSRNNLSGGIPIAFQEMKNLQHINLSSNRLIGEVPKGGVFATINESALMGNLDLCSKQIHMQLCFDSKHKRRLVPKKMIIPIIIGTTIFIMLLVLFIILYRRRNGNQNILYINIGPKIISYEELEEATGQFSESNLLGVGGSGLVYKGILNNGTNVAVKVINYDDENALQIFHRECDVLKRVKHHNVMKIISTCSSSNFKALILPLMSNGSLERWLYPDEENECKLNLFARLGIAKDIAQGMAYLHHHCFVKVIHCDLKPTNVLLGDDMTSYIADFGSAKLLFGNSMDLMTSTNAIKGSIGYIAPEYGMGGNISTKGDVYSYGILLLELFMRKRPTNDMFAEGINLPKWIGLFCTRELPQQRPNMMEIIERLERITETFLGSQSFQMPMDISPFLENTCGLKDYVLESCENWSTFTF